MSGIDAFRYDGKRVLVVGGATGMGAAAARTASALGAHVTVLDIAPVDYRTDVTIEVDLRDRAAVDDAIDRIPGPVHAIFAAAGVADGTPGIMKVNFISHRHILENLLARNAMPAGAAVCLISSVAGIGWETNIPQLTDFLATPDYDSADAWVAAHDGTDTYTFSKQAMCLYVARQSFPLMAAGIRINSICPGPTDTPLARANAETWLGFAQDYRDATGTKHLTPDQMGDTMIFLNSDAASGISGVNLLVDAGHVMSSMTGSWAPGQPTINFLMGRS